MFQYYYPGYLMEPMPVRLPEPVVKASTTVYGGAADADLFTIEADDLWSFWQHPITGAVQIQIPTRRIQPPMRVVK